MIKDVSNLAVVKLLSTDNNNKQLRYVIPPYQREYTWKKENWETLFDDINENQKGYFLGSIICIAQDNYMEVIDGQQRLTTISILLNAIYAVFKVKLNDESISAADRKYSKPFNQLEDQIYIYDEKKSRLTLSIQKNNNSDYEDLLKLNDILEFTLSPTISKRSKIYKAYKYFKERLEEIDEDSNLFDIDGLLEFYKKVTSTLIVKIEVNDISSAFTLFESINNRGIPLTPIDLIKNSIISKMESRGKEPQEINKQWQSLINNIESYVDQVRFLRHYYHAFINNDKVKLVSYSKATKSNIIKIYSEHISSDVEFIFNELIEKSNIYSIFLEPENITDPKYLPYKEMLMDLKILKIAPAYSLLLYLFNKDTDDDLDKILATIESWYIRRHMTNFPGTGKLDQIFLDIINLLSSNTTKSELDIITNYLHENKRYTNDEEFENFLHSDDLYDINPNTTRYMLIKLEKSKRTRENNVNFWDVTNKNKAKWSVEHILPQKMANNSAWETLFTTDQHKKYIHRLGNLTITAYNSNLSNKSFEDKCNIGEYNLKSGKIQINNDIQNIDIWNTDVIENRSKLLAKDLINIFSYNF
jgi:uncharacterized protein with ParB-like and HNH nuclease domain